MPNVSKICLGSLSRGYFPTSAALPYRWFALIRNLSSPNTVDGDGELRSVAKPARQFGHAMQI